ncbi:MAG: hypothetical protein AAF658_03605 [Myxococcota bacterium]
MTDGLAPASNQTMSDRARERALTPIPVRARDVGLPELRLPSAPTDRLERSAPLRRSDAQEVVAARSSGLEAPAERPGRLSRLYDAAHARLREAAYDAATDDLSVDLGVAELDLEMLEWRELSASQRRALRENPRAAFARTRLEVDLDLIPDLQLGDFLWDPAAPLTVTIDLPIEILREGNEEQPVRWSDVYDVLKTRLVEVIRDGVPTLDGSTLGGEPWPLGGQIQMIGEFRNRLRPDLDDVRGFVERRDALVVSAERVGDERVDVRVGAFDQNRIRPYIALDELRLSGRYHDREFSQGYYPLNLNDPAHQSAFRELLDFRRVAGVPIPRLTTDALDELGLGHAEFLFSRALDPSPHVRVPLSYVTVGGGVRRYESVTGWVQFPRKVQDIPLDADAMANRIDALLSGNRDAISAAPPGTRMVSTHRTQFDWHTLISAHTTESILNGYLSLGAAAAHRRTESDQGLVQRDVQWVEAPNGETRAVLAYRAFDREAVRNRLASYTGIRIGPELRRLIRRRGDEDRELEENLADFLEDFWTDPDDFFALYFDGERGDRHNTVERELNDLLDFLSLRATSDQSSSIFHQTRLRTRPLDLSDPEDRAFFDFAMSDHPVDDVLVEGARLDLFTEQRFDEGVRERTRRTFEALTLRLALSRDEWTDEQSLVFT